MNNWRKKLCTVYAYQQKSCLFGLFGLVAQEACCFGAALKVYLLMVGMMA